VPVVNMRKLIVICGPTATGKTSLGVILSQKLGGEIVSADSRQVYKGMDIGTGKEWGKDVVVWGYDLADPRHDYSVAQYVKFAQKAIIDIQERGRLPILVGGTGLYIKAVVDGIPTVSVPRNSELRDKLSGKPPDELYEALSNLDSVRAASMNFSDKKNPRRLIRAIEIAQWKLSHGKSSPSISRPVAPSSILFIGLTAPREFIEKKIEARVSDRIKKGIKLEIRDLLKGGVKWEDQSMMSLGYRQWRDYFEGAVDEARAVSEWIREEKKYARRQITWFKKDKRILWFDVSEPDYPKSVEKLAEKWYKMGYVEKD